MKTAVILTLLTTTNCDLFSAVCDVNTGFTINIENEYKNLSSNLPTDNNGLFVYSESSLEMDEDGILNMIDNLNPNCKFNGLSV